MNLGTLWRRATTRRARKIRTFSLAHEPICLRLCPAERDKPPCFYVGCARDLKDRLRRHNTGEVSHTAKWKPWRIKTFIAFSDQARAREFEQYLESASGRAFAANRLLKGDPG